MEKQYVKRTFVQLTACGGKTQFRKILLLLGSRRWLMKDQSALP